MSMTRFVLPETSTKYISLNDTALGKKSKTQLSIILYSGVNYLIQQT